MYDLLKINWWEGVFPLFLPFDGRQLQQALGEQNRTIKCAAHRFQALSPQSGIAARQRHRRLSFQHCQRSFELVRGIGAKALLAGNHHPQPIDIAVKGDDQ